VGYQGQTGNYTDTETLHAAAGLFTALSGPGGLYYNPESGVGMARSRADALNTYDQLLHPFDGWTFGAYAHEVGQFGIGEGKGFVNMGAGGIVEVSPALRLADAQTGGHLSHPLASVGESQEDGEAFAPVAVALAGGVEALAAAPEAAEGLAGVPRGGFAANPLSFIGEPTEALPEAREAFSKVANSDAFLSKAGITRGSAEHDALNSALNDAEYRKSGFQGGWAGIGANGKIVLGISRGNLNNRFALSHELHHLVRHTRGITPFESEAQMRGLYRYRAWMEEARTFRQQFFGSRR